METRPNGYLEGGPADGRFIVVDLEQERVATWVGGPDRSSYRRTDRRVRTAWGLCVVWEYHGTWRNYDTT